MKKIIISALFCLPLLSCSNDDSEDSTICDLKTIIDFEKYANKTSSELTINSLEFNASCLEVSIRSSGCDGDSWNLELIDSGEVVFQTITVDPPTGDGLAIRNLRFVLENNEDCEALITKNYTFDITNLMVDNENEVELNFQDTLLSILYQY